MAAAQEIRPTDGVLRGRQWAAETMQVVKNVSLRWFYTGKDGIERVPVPSRKLYSDYSWLTSGPILHIIRVLFLPALHVVSLEFILHNRANVSLVFWPSWTDTNTYFLSHFLFVGFIVLYLLQLTLNATIKKSLLTVLCCKSGHILKDLCHFTHFHISTRCLTNHCTTFWIQKRSLENQVAAIGR